MKDTTKLINNVLRALPLLPLLAPKRKSYVASYLVGAFGVALVGGVAAVMYFSPRTRMRTLDLAKDSYGKVKGQLGQLGIADRLGLAHGERTTTPEVYSNGLSAESARTGQQTNTY